MAESRLSLDSRTKIPWEYFNTLVLSARIINRKQDQKIKIKNKTFTAISFLEHENNLGILMCQKSCVYIFHLRDCSYRARQVLFFITTPIVCLNSATQAKYKSHKVTQLVGSRGGTGVTLRCGHCQQVCYFHNTRRRTY